eukprot:1457210-Amphidinium_carterae.2
MCSFEPTTKGATLEDTQGGIMCEDDKPHPCRRIGCRGDLSSSVDAEISWVSLDLLCGTQKKLWSSRLCLHARRVELLLECCKAHAGV